MYSIDQKFNFESESNSKFKKSDFLIIVIFLAYFLVDFIPAMKSVIIVGPHYLYFAILNTLVSIYILYNRFKFKILINIPTKLYFTFIGICCLSLFVARNITEGILSLIYLTIVLITFLNFTILLHNRLYLFNSLVIIISINVFLQTYIVLDRSILQLTGSKLIQFLGNIKGNTGNINILVASLNVKLPFIIYAVLIFKNWKKIFFIITLILASITIFLINARAGLLAFSLELIILTIGYIYLVYKKKKYIFNLLYVIIPIIIGLNISNSILNKTKDSGRFVSVGNRLAKIPLNKSNIDASAQLRLLYWKNALQITKEKPLLGLGIGNWKIESIPYEKTIGNNIIVSYNVHNDFLQIMAETGPINGIIYLCIFVFVFFTETKNIFSKKNNSYSKIISLIILSSLTGYMIDACFNFPMYRPTMQLSLALFLALSIVNTYIHIASNTHFLTTEIPYFRKIGVLSIFLSCITIYYSFIAFQTYKWLALINHDMKENKFEFKADDLEKNKPDFPNIMTNTIPIDQLIAQYYLKENKYDKALIKLDQAKKINPYIGEADWYKAEISLSKKNIDSTYYYFREAFQRRPKNKQYFQKAIFFAGIQKDTLEILKLHNAYTQSLENWLLTSKALIQAGYNKRKTINFINTALTEFPNDTILLDRKNNLLQKRSTGTKNEYLSTAHKHFLKEEYKKAIPYFKKAVIEDKNDFQTQLNLGICYFYLSNFKSALPYLIQAQKANINKNGKVEFLLGISYVALGNKIQGCQFLQIATNKKFEAAIKISSTLCK